MPGPSGWTTAFTRPDPLDPNDRVRQRTQSRADDYPYDKPVSYGASSHAGLDGSERQDGADRGPPRPRNMRPDRPHSVWDRISDSLDVMTNGPQSELSAPLGYGSHGRMGEDGLDAFDLELDALKRDFRSSYEAALPVTDEMEPRDLFTLLTRLDPDFAAETFTPEDENEMRDVYSCWADRVIGREE